MISNIINYLTTDSIGLIILAVMTSLFSSMVYSVCQWMLIKGVKHYKCKKHISNMVKSAIAFMYGARAVTVQLEKNGALQSFWAVDFIMTALNYALKIISILVLTLIALYLLPPILYFLPIVVSSIWLSILYKKFGRNQKYFDKSLDLMFGEEYLEKEKEGYQEYWKSFGKKQEGKNQTAKKTEEEE